mmetsp:Transcript_58309/g.143052  ORF Transcript_58309/g.143052 Transcript_58309/m.143052 type:complete len:327 (+) Transcript_58309:1101-2081(+)
MHDRRLVEVECALVLAQQLARPMPQQLVDGHLHLEALATPLLEEQLVLGSQERDLLRRRSGGQHVAEGDVLEALVLPNVVVVGDVDAGGDAGRRKGDNIKRREIRPQELVFLERGGPRQHRDELRRVVNERLELAALLTVDDGHEALELAAHAEGVPVRLDEADVCLNGGGLVHDPRPLRVLVIVDVAAVEMLHVELAHLKLLRAVCGTVGRRLLDVVRKNLHEGRMVPILDHDLGPLKGVCGRELRLCARDAQLQHVALLEEARVVRLVSDALVCKELLYKLDVALLDTSRVVCADAIALQAELPHAEGEVVDAVGDGLPPPNEL